MPIFTKKTHTQISQIRFKGQLSRADVGKRRAVMTIHGFLTDDEDFCRLYDYLPRVYERVYRCVLPGHGTPKNFDEFTTEATVKKVLECYDDLAQGNYDSIDIIGFSMGGALATYLSTCRKIANLVLLSPANRFLNPGMSYRWGKFYIEKFIAAVRQNGGDIRDIQDELEPYVLTSKKATQITIKRLLPNYNYHTLKTLADVVAYCNKALIEKKAITNPTLMIWGELDELVPRKSVAYLETLCTDCKTIIYPDVGHMLLYAENSKKIIDEIMDFVK